MASVHLARIAGDAGFARTVAIKRLHPQFASDPEFASMFIDEARLAARIKHPNVVPTLDVVAEGEELFLVMEYIDGDSLSGLIRSARERNVAIPPDVGLGIVIGLLHGLHAAHEARNEDGSPLDIVHRDVSPQNVLVGTDGIARVLDFGIAKAVGQAQTTREGTLKGKVPYFAPEQIQGARPTRQFDVFAAGVVLWEVLCGERLFAAENEAATLGRILSMAVPAPSTRVAGLSPAVDAVLVRALARDPAARYATALEFAEALEATNLAATTRRIGEWVRDLAGPRVEARAALVAAIERSGGASLSGPTPRVSAAFETASTAAALTTPTPAPSERTPRTVSLGAAIAIVGAASTGLAVVVIGLWVALHRPATPEPAVAAGPPAAASAVALPPVAATAPPTSASAASPAPPVSASASASVASTATARATAPTAAKKPDAGAKRPTTLYGRD